MSTAPAEASRTALDDLLSGPPEAPATQAAWLVERSAWLTDEARDNLMVSAPDRLHLLVGDAMRAAEHMLGLGREATAIAEAALEQVAADLPGWSASDRAWLAQAITGAALSLLIDDHTEVDSGLMAGPWRTEVGELDPVTATPPTLAGTPGRHLYAVPNSEPSPEADEAKPEAGQQAFDLGVAAQAETEPAKKTKKPKTLHPTWFTPVWPEEVTRPEARYTEIDAGLDGHVTVEQVIDGVSLGMGILTNAKVHRWADLNAVLPEHVRVTDEQLDLLHAVEPLLALVGVAVRKDGVSEKGIKLAVCADCGRWLLMSGGATPKRCTMTIDCGGAPVTIKPATAADQPAFDKLPGSMSRDMAGSF